jgi:hypothetical protein
MRLKKEEVKALFDLYSKYSWLTSKENEIIELLRFCMNERESALVKHLLKEFIFLDNGLYGSSLDRMANFIVGRPHVETETQVAAIAYDEEADSSQRILDHIKNPVFKLGWKKCTTVNRFGDITKNIKLGYKNVILVDEFIGSGQTMIGRIKQLRHDTTEEYNIKICVLAAMGSTLKIFKDKGIEVFCPIVLKKGILEHFRGDLLRQNIVEMSLIESRLEKKVGENFLINYHFGYGRAEALFTSESIFGNTPNSVFPIFWWPSLKNKITRKTLLNRTEKGF